MGMLFYGARMIDVPRVMVVPVAQLRVDGADLAPWSVVVFLE